MERKNKGKVIVQGPTTAGEKLRSKNFQLIYLSPASLFLF